MKTEIKTKRILKRGGLYRVIDSRVKECVDYEIHIGTHCDYDLKKWYTNVEPRYIFNTKREALQFVDCWLKNCIENNR